MGRVRMYGFIRILKAELLIRPFRSGAVLGSGSGADQSDQCDKHRAPC